MAIATQAITMLTTILLLAILARNANGLQVSYCSSENTADDSTQKSNHYQSNGSCQVQCQGNYALAVLQGSVCWCTNFAPADTTDGSSCNTGCPGFPSDTCGNPNEGLYGYFKVGSHQISGTIGASSSSSAPSTSASASASSSAAPSPSPVSSPGFSPGPSPTKTFPVPVTVVTSVISSLTTVLQGTTAPPSVVTTVSTTTVPSTVTPSSSSLSSSSSSSFLSSSEYSAPPPPSSSSPTSSPSTSTSSSSSSQSTNTVTEPPSSVTSVVTQTQEGRTILQTIVTTPTSEPVAGPRPKASSSISHGAIAGIVIGVLAALGIVAAGLITYYRKRLKQERRRTQYQDDSGSFGPHSEKYSPMENEGQKWDPTFGIGFIPGRKSQRSSTHLKTTTSRRSTNADTSISPIDRQSMTFVDSRLNPQSFGVHEAGRVSAQSLADHQDYSRPLRVTNGDDQ